MTLTNTITAPAYPGQGVNIKIDSSEASEREVMSWAYIGMEVKSDDSDEIGIVANIDRQGGMITIIPAQPNLKFSSSSAFFEEGKTISNNETRIGNRIWKTIGETTLKFLDGAEIPIVTNNTIWANNTTGAAAYYNNDQSTYPAVLYNRYAVLRGLSTMTNGWRIPVLSDVYDLCIATGDGTHVGTLNDGILPYKGGSVKSVSLFGTDFGGFNAIGTGVKASTGSFSLPNACIYHINPEPQLLPDWFKSVNFKVPRNFYFAFLGVENDNNTYFFSSTNYTTAWGVRLCRNL